MMLRACGSRLSINPGGLEEGRSSACGSRLSINPGGLEEGRSSRILHQGVCTYSGQHISPGSDKSRWYGA
jgi:hypothetical protein